MTGYITDLLGTGGAERELPGSKQVLASIVDGTRGENIRGNGVLQSGDQLHVESEREDLLGWQDNYRIPRVSLTRVAK